MTHANNKPDYELRLGRVRVAIWKNTTKDNKVWYNVSLTRTWKEEDGKWREASTFSGLSEVVLMQEALRQARDWIQQREELASC